MSSTGRARIRPDTSTYYGHSVDVDLHDPTGIDVEETLTVACFATVNDHFQDSKYKPLDLSRSVSHIQSSQSTGESVELLEHEIGM